MNVQQAPGWYSHPERPEEEWYWDGAAWTESRWATEPQAPRRRAVQRDPGGFLRDLAVMVLVLGLAVFGFTVGSHWAGLNTWDTILIVGFPLCVFGGVFWYWLGEEDS